MPTRPLIRITYQDENNYTRTQLARMIGVDNNKMVHCVLFGGPRDGESVRTPHSLCQSFSLEEES